MVTMYVLKGSAIRVFFVTTVQFGRGAHVTVALKRGFETLSIAAEFGKEIFIIRFLNESLERRSRLRFPQQKVTIERHFFVDDMRVVRSPRKASLSAQLRWLSP
jgi:hypothetical protein